MAEKKLNTRISLRYDSYDAWQASTVQLLPGEVAICYIDANNGEIKNTAPTVLFKVGDGEHTFKDLKWSSARAADVFDWAKVEGANVFTKVGNGNVVSGIEWDATLNNNYGGFKVSTASVATSEGLAELQGKVKTIEETTIPAIQASIKEIVETSIPTLEGEIERVEGLFAGYYTKEQADAKFLTAHQDISGKADKSYVDEELAKKADKTSVYTKEEADGKFLTSHQDISGKADKSYVDEELAKKAVKSEVEAALNLKADQTTVDQVSQVANAAVKQSDYDVKVQALDAKDLEIIGLVESEALRAGGVEEGLDARIFAIEEDYLVADDIANKVDRSELDSYYTKTEADATFIKEHQDISGKADITYVDEEIEKVNNAIELLTDGAGTDEIDSVKELINYVNNHGATVEGLQKEIDANEAAIKVINETTIPGLEERIEDLEAFELPENLVQDANYKHITVTSTSVSDGENTFTKYDDTALAGRVSVVEGAVATVDSRIESAVSGEASRVNSLLAEKADKSELFSKDYNDLVNTPDLSVYEKSADLVSLKSDVATIKGDYLKAADKTELSNAINTEKGRIDTLVNETVPAINKAIEDEAKLAREEEGKLAQAIADEKSRAEGIEAGFKSRIESLEAKPFDTYATKEEVQAEAKSREDADKALSDRIDAYDARFGSASDILVFDCGGAN